MPANDEDYHVRRAREHRALAETAATEKAKLPHIAWPINMRLCSVIRV